MKLCSDAQRTYKERERFEVHGSNQQISPASNASAMSAYSCLMSLSPPLSLICMSFTLSLHAVMCIRALREKRIWKQTHTRPGNTCRVSSDDIALRDRAVDVTCFSKSPWRRFSPFLSTLYPQYLFSSTLHLYGVLSHFQI